MKKTEAIYRLGLFATALVLTGCACSSLRASTQEIRAIGLNEKYVINTPISWSPSGSELLLVSTTLHDPLGNSGDPWYVAYTISPKDSSVLRYLNIPSTIYPYCWSPDNHSLLGVLKVGTGSTTRRGIVVLDANGEYLDTIVEPADRWLGDFVWSPNGQMIAFVEEEQETYNYYLYILNPDGSDEHTILPPAALHRGSTMWLSGYSSPSWSPDSELIAYAHQGDIYLVRPDGSDVTNLTQTSDIDEDWPTWSPDGQQIAFVVHNGEIRRNAGWVYIMNRDGTKREQVTFDDRTYRRLLWSPDGHWIAAEEELGPIPSASPSSSMAVLIPIEP